MLFFTKMPTGCIHLEKFKQGEGTRIFKVVHAIFVVRATAEARRTKVSKGSLIVLILRLLVMQHVVRIVGGKRILLCLQKIGAFYACMSAVCIFWMSQTY